MQLRSHQREFDDIITAIAAGEKIRDVLMYVTPGGGKSLVSIISGKLIPSMADMLCWVVPRKNLQYQGESNFKDPVFREMFKHNLTIRAAKNERDPARGTHGFTTTYQALSNKNAWHIRESLRGRRYILLLDEVHHVEDEGLWHSSLKQIYDGAALRVMMTGTLARGDKKKIAFIPYRESVISETTTVFSPGLVGAEYYRYIHYSRGDALREKAILPIKFHLYDGKFEWKNEEGERFKADGFMSQTALEHQGDALYTALATEYGEQLLNACLKHYNEYSSGATGLLVVTADVLQARAMLGYLEGIGVNARIATSHESAEAHQNIKDFKAGAFPVLVTIAMAYEGMDAPWVSHIACLTRIRSESWIEQMVARAVRIDKRFCYSDQQAHVFAPVDLKFRELVSLIEEDQNSAMVTQVKRECLVPKQLSLFGDDAEFGEGGADNGIVPIGSRMTGGRLVTIGGKGMGGGIGDVIVKVPGPQTPSEEEVAARKEIRKHVNFYARLHGYKESALNAEIKAAFGDKPRQDMTLKELKTVLKYIMATYPLNASDYRGAATDYEPRASVTKRVPSKAQPFTGTWGGQY